MFRKRGKPDPNYHAMKQETRFKVGDRVSHMAAPSDIQYVVKATKISSSGRIIDTYTLDDVKGGGGGNHFWHNDELKLAPKGIPDKAKPKTQSVGRGLTASALQQSFSQAQNQLNQMQQAAQNANELLQGINQRATNNSTILFYNGYPVQPNNNGGNMSQKFKVGDRVKTVGSNPQYGYGSFMAEGRTGVIKGFNSTGYGMDYTVSPDEHPAESWIGQARDLELNTEPPKAPPPKVEFDSVIMPDTHRQQIMAALAQEDDYKLIFEDWGFGDTMEKGKAISMLFYGPPGTGKTLCAQAIADHVDKKLVVIGTAEIESSSPGQAERNLKAYFEKADKNTVLLFDECDSLVYSRDAVGSILGAQINQLLTCLEKFEGIVIFTTNRLGVLDEAFNRRLSLKLEFPMPNQEQRVLIWQRMFPKKCPLADNINWNKLAELEITGGYIKNIVLRSARMAAHRKLKKITYEVIAEATKAEINSMREFETARDQHKRGIGMAGIDGMGRRMIANMNKSTEGITNG